MYTDKAVYKNVTSRDSMTSTESLGSEITTKARIEIEDTMKKDSEGNLVVFKRLFILPPNVTIKKGDYLKATKIGGADFDDEFHKAEVVFPVARYSLHHYEVYCK